MKRLGFLFIIGIVIGRIGIFVVALMIILGAVAFITGSDEAPDPEKAPYAIQTYSNDENRVPSRVYYAKDVRLDGNMPIIVGYWSYDGRDFHYKKGEKAFPEAKYGQVKLIRRESQ